MESWAANEHLRIAGKVTLLPEEHGVLIHNPAMDLDGSLYQDLPTGGNEWFAYSMRIKGASVYDGGGVLRASAAFMSRAQSGDVLALKTPTHVSGSNWRTYQGVIQVPPGTTHLRVLLSALKGSCGYADISVHPTAAPVTTPTRTKITVGRGFSVVTLVTDRPVWEVFTDDLDQDGVPEIVVCDVDGMVTVRHQGNPPFVTYPAGTLVYQFEAADLTGDGIKEILISSVDPKVPVKAIDLAGREVLSIPKLELGFDRLAAGDLNGDGASEVVVSRGYGIRSASGLAGGFVVYGRNGERLWEREDTLREFHVADLRPEPGSELVAGGPGIEFRTFGPDGKLLASHAFDAIRLGRSTGGDADDKFDLPIETASNPRLDHFAVADVDHDGHSEIIASANTGGRMSIWCLRGDRLLWKCITPELGGSGGLAGMNLAVADFDTTSPGLETVLVGTHDVFLIDATGTLIYRNEDSGSRDGSSVKSVGGIACTDIAVWNERDPVLYLASSRYRHRAYYQLKFGGTDDFGRYSVPDLERHLENLYDSVKKQPARPSAGREKVKVFMAMREFATASAKTLENWRTLFDSLETPGLEYLAMFEASDLLGHERGTKMTVEQVADRARMLEVAGIPFGYFCAHGGQVWLSEEAIRRTKEAAPRMFRFLYIGEDFEVFYSPLYPDILAWIDKTLGYCARNNLKMVFKEKHDTWGTIPSDPEVCKVLFKPEYKNVVVPIWATNQPYEPEVQLGGMLGLKLAGLCAEFGMSTQHWNYHSWGNYPHGIRDVPASSICPADIMLRLELLGLALGGTWVHIENGQPYLPTDPEKGILQQARRHRDLAYELIRKQFIIPGAVPANLNHAAVVLSFHAAMEKGKAERRHVAHPYFHRNVEELRKGFIPARTGFEAYGPDAFPWLAYGSKWNIETCFPRTPFGWITVVPDAAKLPPGMMPLMTDGERIRAGQKWKSAAECSPDVIRMFAEGSASFPLSASGVCLVVQKDPSAEYTFHVLLMDPGYLAPMGAETVLTATRGSLVRVTDLVTGGSLSFGGRFCPVTIPPGAFRILRVELIP